MYFYATGSVHALNVKKSYMVKALGNCKALFLAERACSCSWYGNSDGNSGQWAHQRKVIAPEFFMDKIKVKYWEYSMHGMQTIVWKQATPPSITFASVPHPLLLPLSNFHKQKLDSDCLEDRTNPSELRMVLLDVYSPYTYAYVPAEGENHKLYNNNNKKLKYDIERRRSR